MKTNSYNQNHLELIKILEEHNASLKQRASDDIEAAKNLHQKVLRAIRKSGKGTIWNVTQKSGRLNSRKKGKRSKTS